MAHVSQLPCDGDGLCMLCKAKPSADETLTCKTCATPWHAACLAAPSRPESLASTLQWDCPDCSAVAVSGEAPAVKSGGLIMEIQAIMADESLTDVEKAKRRQELMSGKCQEAPEKEGLKKDVLDVLNGIFNCAFCMELPERPVTTPCGHNFCLKCFKKWVGQQQKRTCIKCRGAIPQKMASQPRINSSLVVAIRMAKLSKSHVTGGRSEVQHYVQNQDRPDKAYTTERAKKTGKANAASGKIFVTIPSDHFGPIPAENDPNRNQGVIVGECWEDRMECRQWGVHFPHVSGIAGQSNHGAQSVVLSGGYQDDEDHGEWFLYTGSGGRDLSGNKRTNKDQSFDQTFEKYNKALQVSCLKGYPVRVVRSHKEKRSSYAPEKGLRYDGVYRIEKCWTKVGVQGFKVCRYLFVRCDNEPAPWTSDVHGDQPRPLPVIPELGKATNITERKTSPSWDFEEKEGWKWTKTPPNSKKPFQTLDLADRKRSWKAMRKAHNMTRLQRLLKEFSCLICHQVMTLPVTTPCAHNFCKSCFEGAFAGKSLLTSRNKGGRTLRTRRNVLNCPSCPTDISDFVQNPQVNTEIMEAIKSLNAKNDEEEIEESAEESSEEMDEDSKEASTQVPEEEAVIDDEQTSKKWKGKGNSPKRQKVDVGSDLPRIDIVEENEVLATLSKDVNENSEMEIAEGSNERQAPGAMPTKKTAGRAGTRGRKKAEKVSDVVKENEIGAVNGDSELENAKGMAPVAKPVKKIAGRAGVGERTRGSKMTEEVSEAVKDNEIPAAGVNGVSELENAEASNELEVPVSKRVKKAVGRAGVAVKTRGRK